MATLHENLKSLGFDCSLKVYGKSRNVEQPVSSLQVVKPSLAGMYTSSRELTQSDICLDSSSGFLLKSIRSCYKQCIAFILLKIQIEI